MFPVGLVFLESGVGSDLTQSKLLFNSLAFIVPENKQGSQPVYRSAGLSPDGPPSECPNSLTHVWLVKATRIT